MRNASNMRLEYEQLAMRQQRNVVHQARKQLRPGSWFRLITVSTAIILISQITISKEQLIVRNNNQVENGNHQYMKSQSNQYQNNLYSRRQPSQQQVFNTVPQHLTTRQQPEFQDQTMTRSQAIASNHLQVAPTDLTEARGPFLRNSLYTQPGSLLIRGAKSVASNASWHFPRFSPEQAAEILIQGAQVINRIAQAETTLNYCKTPDNQEGECSDIRKCIWLVLDKARLKQSVCLRNLVIPAVCCPLQQNNNTLIANVLQSTLEPVLFKPKQPKQKKPQLQLSPPLRPLSSIMNKTIIGSPPPGPISLNIRNQAPKFSNFTNGSSFGAPVNSLNGFHQNSEVSGDQVISGEALNDDKSTLWLQSSTTTTQAPNSSQNNENNKSPGIPTKSPVSSTPFSLFQSAEDGDQSQPGSSSRPNNLAYAGGYNRTIGHKYPWSNETCGDSGRTRTGRIVGGTDSKLGQWPWMTAMYLNKRSPFIQGAGEFWCGGALISRRFILTAAHCLSDQRGNRYRTDQVTIKLGGIDLVRHQAPVDMLRNAELELPAGSSAGQMLKDSFNVVRRRNSGIAESWPARDSSKRGEDDAEFSWTSFITKALGLISGSPSHTDGSTKSLNPQEEAKKLQLAVHAKKTYFKEYKVANIKQHPKFQRHGFYNDIGLIELKSDVDYDDLISPICLPNEYDLKRDLAGYMATVLGWGTLSYGGQGSKMLQQVSMPIWDNKDCDDRYLQHIGKTFLCAGFLTGGKDACQGDSGGPLMVSDKTGRWTLHGVVSFGKTCAQAGYPGVYTRVTEYLDWITENTDPGAYS